jgi:hypothetical protein
MQWFWKIMHFLSLCGREVKAVEKASILHFSYFFGVIPWVKIIKGAWWYWAKRLNVTHENVLSVYKFNLKDKFRIELLVVEIQNKIESQTRKQAIVCGESATRLNLFFFTLGKSITFVKQMYRQFPRFLRHFFL